VKGRGAIIAREKKSSLGGARTEGGTKKRTRGKHPEQKGEIVIRP